MGGGGGGGWGLGGWGAGRLGGWRAGGAVGCRGAGVLEKLRARARAPSPCLPLPPAHLHQVSHQLAQGLGATTSAAEQGEIEAEAGGELAWRVSTLACGAAVGEGWGVGGRAVV